MENIKGTKFKLMRNGPIYIINPNEQDQFWRSK
jgi:hypothetical protein